MASIENSIATGRRLLKEVRAQGIGTLVRGQLPLIITYLGSSFSLVFGSVMQLISMAILARALGVVQFGQYLAMMALGTFAMQFVGLGSIESLVRRVAREESIYPVALGHSLILTALTTIVICPILMTALPAWANSAHAAAIGFIAIAIFAVANTTILHLVLLVERIFIAHGHYARANLVNLSLSFTRLLVTILACEVLGVTSLEYWIEWQAVSYVIVLVGCLIAVRPLGMPRWSLMRDELRQGFFYSIASAVTTLRQTIDILVLGLVATPAIVGSFGLARRIVDTSVLTLVAFFRIAYPALSRAMADGISGGLALAGRVLVAALGIAVLTGIGVYIVAPACPMLFGSQYNDVVHYLHFLAWILIPYAVSSTASDALGASTQHGMRAALYCSTVLGTLVVGWLTYAYSVTGTIIGLYVTEIAIAILFWAAVFFLARREGKAASQSRSSDEPLRR